MYRLASAKINIGLRVLSRTPQGLHNIASLFVPVQWYDLVEVLPCDDMPPIQLTHSGITIGGENEADNLVYRAIAATIQELGEGHHQKSSYKAHLHKAIPIGAGLGGGSSDAVATLHLLQALYSTELTQQKIKKIAAQLGSDCSFFVQPQPTLVEGIGDQLTPFQIDFSCYHFLFVYLPISISTKWAYQQIAPNPKDQMPLTEALQEPISHWKDTVTNDFEKVAFSAFPVLGRLKRLLYSQGALYASMTGSGSVVYGIFSEEHSLPLSGDFQKCLTPEEQKSFGVVSTYKCKMYKEACKNVSASN